MFYNIAIFIGNLLNYLHVKQESLLKDFDNILFGAECLSNRNSHQKSHLVYAKYVNINRSYGKLLCEINDYNQIISRFLDNSFFLFITVIAYLTFILFFNKTNFVITVFFILLHVSNIITLSCLILACSTITAGNEAMSKRTLKLFNISLKRHFHTVQLMKVCPRGMDFVN